MTSTVEWMNGRITDAGVQAAVAQIGVPKPRRPVTITEDKIGGFALGVGDDNPLWWDREYARGTRWRAMFAPPTSIYGGGQRRPGEREVGSYTETILPGVLGLWIGDRWQFHRHAFLGELITGSTALHEVREDQVEERRSFSGRTVTHVERTEFLGPDGDLVAELFRTLRRFERGEVRARGKYLDLPEPVYSPEQIQAIADQYEREPGQRRGGVTRYFEDVAAGDTLITLVKGPLTLSGLFAFLQGLGGSSPANRLMYRYLRDNPGGRIVNEDTGIEDYIGAAHYDSYFARKSGLPRGYDLGAMRSAWLVHLLTDWMGDDGFITAFDMRLRRPNFIGDTTWLNGTVTRTQGDGADGLVVCELSATNQREEISASATATVRLPRRSPQP